VRVGRPVKALPEPHCDYCGVRPRSKHNVPLGRLAGAPLREAKSRLHDMLEPLAGIRGGFGANSMGMPPHTGRCVR
jgi:hypothetical protein